MHSFLCCGSLVQTTNRYKQMRKGWSKRRIRMKLHAKAEFPQKTCWKTRNLLKINWLPKSYVNSFYTDDKVTNELWVRLDLFNLFHCRLNQISNKTTFLRVRAKGGETGILQIQPSSQSRQFRRKIEYQVIRLRIFLKYLAVSLCNCIGASPVSINSLSWK